MSSLAGSRVLPFVALTALALAASPPSVESPSAESIPYPQEDEGREPSARAGWSALYRGATTVATTVPRASFTLRAGETLHPALAARGWNAVYRTELELPQSGRYRFGAESDGGRATLRVGPLGGRRRDALGTARSANDTAFTEWIEFEAGWIQLELNFQASGPGDLRLRALWELESTSKHGFRAEPIPTQRARVPAAGVASARAEQLDFRGRLLLEQRGCTNCHLALGAAGLSVGRRTAPDLSAVGGRLWSTWIDRWLAAPHALVPDAGMPDLFGEGPAEDKLRGALVHYLTTRTGDAPPEPGAIATEPEVLARGRALYHARGCIACHDALASPADALANEMLDSELLELPVVRPFGDIAGKWKPAALAEFLVDPGSVHRDGRMPSLALDAEEADLIATYLASEWGAGADVEPLPEFVERGAVEYLVRGCAACHGTLEPNIDMPIPGRSLISLDPLRGCLDPDDQATPRYAFAPGERELLRAGLGAAARARGAYAPLDEAERRIESLACRACHVIDGTGGVHPELDIYFQPEDERTDLGDEGRLPPRLDAPGTKLTTSWLGQVLDGTGVARPYLGLRMPTYGAEQTAGLAELFARREGLEPHTDALHPEASDDDVLIGRELMGRRAFACITCHVYRDYPPVGTPGPALTQFGERLRYEWFRAYMQDPQRTSPGGRMPTFGTGGVSSIQTILGGDLQAQSDAMWAYFGLGEFMPVPEGVELGSAMKLVPQDRPIVLRAFLDPAGSRAVAVGTPLGVHYSFDTEACRLVDIWQGDFVDAAGSWAGRGGSVLEGRGMTLWQAPFVDQDAAAEGSRATGADAASHGDSTVEARYRGYRLAADGNPSFLYELVVRGSSGTPLAVAVEESFEVQAQPVVVLRRVFRLTASMGDERVHLQVRGEGELVESELGTGAELGAESTDGVQSLTLGVPGAVTILVFEVRP